MFWAAAALFALVISLLLLTILRPGFGSRLSPGGWIVAGGLAMPTIVLTLLVAYAFAQGERLLFASAGEPPLRVEAHGRQWAWDFAYPDFPDVPPTTNVLHIPAGRTIEVVASSSDVIHSFWVPRLGGKIDAIPGHRTAIRLRADRPGVYGGVCSEFCGTGHTVMRFTVEAHPPETYEEILRAGDENR